MKKIHVAAVLGGLFTAATAAAYTLAAISDILTNQARALREANQR